MRTAIVVGAMTLVLVLWGEARAQSAPPGETAAAAVHACQEAPDGPVCARWKLYCWSTAPAGDSTCAAIGAPIDGFAQGLRANLAIISGSGALFEEHLQKCFGISTSDFDSNDGKFCNGVRPFCDAGWYPSREVVRICEKEGYSIQTPEVFLLPGETAPATGRFLTNIDAMGSRGGTVRSNYFNERWTPFWASRRWLRISGARSWSKVADRAVDGGSLDIDIHRWFDMYAEGGPEAHVRIGGFGDEMAPSDGDNRLEGSFGMFIGTHASGRLRGFAHAGAGIDSIHAYGFGGFAYAGLSSTLYLAPWLRFEAAVGGFLRSGPEQVRAQGWLTVWRLALGVEVNSIGDIKTTQMNVGLELLRRD